MLGTRARVVTLLVVLPALALFSLAGAFVGFSGVRLLERSRPELVLPALSALAALIGLSWALSPLLAGVAATEAHDLTRLVHYPVPLTTLVVSSLLANLGQPLVLAQIPPLAAVALALAGGGCARRSWPSPRSCSASSSRSPADRRSRSPCTRSRGTGAGTIAPLVVGIALERRAEPGADPAPQHGRRASRAGSRSPCWSTTPSCCCRSRGVRAPPCTRGAASRWRASAWTVATLLALAGALAVSAALAGRLYRGELDLGEAPARRTPRAPMRLPGAVGALVEKDLRVVWRDPRLKALLFTGLVGPAADPGRALAGDLERVARPDAVAGLGRGARDRGGERLRPRATGPRPPARLPGAARLRCSSPRTSARWCCACPRSR